MARNPRRIQQQRQKRKAKQRSIRRAQSGSPYRQIGRTGEVVVPFEALEMDLGKDRCGIIGDVISANTMTPGGFRYDIRVIDGDDEPAVGSRSFLAAAPPDVDSGGP